MIDFSNIPPAVRFSGQTYDPILDCARLTSQSAVVFRLMSDGTYRSLAAIAHATGFPEASISARLRDFRTVRFGSHTVERRRGGWGGSWEYRLTPATDMPE